MKRDFKVQTSDFRLIAFVLCLCLVAIAASAITANPYEAIVGRNVFGLKPPTLTAPPAVAPAAATITIKLQGISTILDRKQVLLKVKTAARPPEPAKEQSYLWSEGQGEDDIEVLAIDAANGTVTIKNRGETVPLTMKDDAEKPAVGATLPGPAVPSLQAPMLPGVTPPATPALPPANPGGSGRTIPTRSLRTSSTDGAGLGVGTANTSNPLSLSPQQQVAAQRTPEESAALYEINRAKNEQLRQSGVNLPRLPQHPMFKGSQ